MGIVWVSLESAWFAGVYEQYGRQTCGVRAASLQSDTVHGCWCVLT